MIEKPVLVVPPDPHPLKLVGVRRCAGNLLALN